MASLHMLTNISDFSMSFVIETDKGNCIVIDGGHAEDTCLIKDAVAGRPIPAWILTHAHNDHIGGFIAEFEKNGGADFDIGTVYYNFPNYDALIDRHDVPDYDYFKSELHEILPKFNAIKHMIRDKEHIVTQGETLNIDEVHIEFLFSYHDGLFSNLMNDSSLVFRVTTPNTSVLFLGDLGPDGGDILFRESFDKLPSDIVQMAHHGHMNVSMEVYAAIAPKACLWPAPLWLYNEDILPWYLTDTEQLMRQKRIRMYGTGLTRRWMDQLGVKTHYVSGEGTQIIPL